MKKGQIALEYIIVVGLAISLMIGYLLIVSDIQKRTSDNANWAEVDRIAGVLQSELIVASQVKDGYERTFELPLDVRGNLYTIQSDNGSVTVGFDEYTGFRLTPVYSGAPVPGNNNITKINGSVRIN